MKPPTGLTPQDAALWQRVTATVTPIHSPLPLAEGVGGGPVDEPPTPSPSRRQGGKAARPTPAPAPAPPGPGLDASWDRKLARATVRPDFTLDLHGHTLDQAHRRLDHGLVQAKAMGARLVLLITGKPRPVDPADRGHKRGAIRAKVLDWLAAGPHAGDIAAIRQAHRRHGGDGALYLVLKRPR